MSLNKNNNSNVITIRPVSKWGLINLREIYSSKDLLYYMVSKDIKILYKQTILGFLWAIIRPVFSMIVFTFIFGNLARIPSDGIPYPVFSYCALVPWIYFSGSLTKSSASLLQSIGIFTKIYFPRIFIPLTPVLAGLADFFIALSVLFLMMFYFNIKLTITILFLPILIIIVLFTSFGLGLWLSALAIQYRDVRHAVQFLTQIMMYAAPVVWPFSLFKEKFGESLAYAYSIYPMVGVIEGFRASILGLNQMPWDSICIGALSSVLIFISGLFYFKNREHYFADVA